MLSFKILTIGDCHFKTNNIPECEEYIVKVIDIIKEKELDFIVMLGDLLDTHNIIDTVPLNKMYSFIKKLRDITKVFILVGNHDLVNNQEFLTDEHWMNGLKEWKNVVIVDKVIEYNNFLFVPYVYPGRFIEALNTLDGYDWKNARCIFAHQEFYGCSMGAIKSQIGDIWDKKYPYVVSGHIHCNQTLDNIYYTGSSMQLSYSDGSGGILSYFTFNEKEKYELDEIPIDLPKKKLIYTDIEKIKNIDIKALKEKNDHIKLSISGDYTEFKSFKNSKQYKELTQNGIKVVFKQHKKEIKHQNKVIQDLIDEHKNINLDTTDFSSLLYRLIENDKQLVTIYRKLIEQ